MDKYLVTSWVRPNMLIQAKTKEHCREIFAQKAGYMSYAEMMAELGPERCQLDIKSLQNIYTLCLD